MTRNTQRHPELRTRLMMGLTLSVAACSLAIVLSGCGASEPPADESAKQTEPTPSDPAPMTEAAETSAQTPTHKTDHRTSGHAGNGQATTGQTAMAAEQSAATNAVARFVPPDQGDNPVITIDLTRKPASIMQRSLRRAYLGAPPVIPHSILDQTSSDDCMVCHHKGLNSGQLVTPPIPHPYLTNCTQCHVEMKATNAMASYLSDNTFDGLDIPMSGTRAWEGAPPTIPHPLWMRDNCLSCHGETARPGLETTHPWRQSCTQCHVIQPGMAQQP